MEAYAQKESLNFRNKAKSSNNLTTLNSLNRDGGVKKRWKNDNNSSSNTNSSTLSLHIAAYENSIESDTVSSHKIESLKKNVKETKDTTFNLFEFPRQQTDGETDPAIMQFTASQQLFNPNQSFEVVSLECLSSSPCSALSIIESNSQVTNSENQVTPLSKKARTIFNEDYKKELLRKIETGECKLVQTKPEDILRYVVPVSDDKNRLAVHCTICGTFMSTKGGGSISYHRTMCLKASDLSKQVPFPVSVDDRKEFVLAVLKSLTSNYLSASLFNNEVFLEMLQLVHNMGYKYGSIKPTKDEVCYGPASIAAIMPHRTNIRRTLDRTVAEKFPLLVDLVSFGIAGGGGAITCDMTTKLYHYVGYTAHFITDDWNLLCVPICMKEFSQKPTAVNILEDTVNVLNEFSTTLSQLVFVSDEGSSVVAAYKRQSQIVCINHGFNTVVKRSLDPYKETKRMPIRLSDVSKAVIAELNSLVKTVKELSQFVKRRPEINTILDLRLILDAETRWMSKLLMVKRTLNMSAEDEEKLRDYLGRTDNTMLEKFNLIRHQSEKLKIFVKIFEPFLEAMRSMEAEKRPTLYLTPIFYSKLLSQLEEYKQSSDTTTAGLAESVHAVLVYKKSVLLTDDHYMALLLNPKHNGLVEKVVPEKIDNLFERLLVEGGALYNSEPNITTDTKFAGRKRQRQQQSSVESEIDEFINISIPEDVDFSLLKWWKENSARFPRLSKLAKKYHSIPATSAAVERLFSVLNMLTPDERLSLTPEALTNMIKLRAILQLFP